MCKHKTASQHIRQSKQNINTKHNAIPFQAYEKSTTKLFFLFFSVKHKFIKHVMQTAVQNT